MYVDNQALNAYVYTIRMYVRILHAYKVVHISFTCTYMYRLETCFKVFVLTAYKLNICMYTYVVFKSRAYN